MFSFLKNSTSSFIPKEYTLQIKGVAILMMLFLHLFNNATRYPGMYSMVVIDNQPLTFLLSQICSICVPIYLIMSGYGLWIVYQRGQKMHNARRVFLLYLRVILVAFIILPLSYFFWGGVYNMDFRHLVLGLSGIQPYYNDEWWFLFPWAVICLISPILFKILIRLGTCKSTVMFFVSYLGLSWLISQSGNILFSMPWRLVYQFILVVMLSFPFLLGAIAAKTGIFLKVQSWSFNNRIFLFLFMISVFGIRMFVFHHGFLNPLIAFGACCLVLTMKPNKLLIGFGKASTTMWLVHTFFCYYYLHDWFQTLKYPIIMYIVLVIYSYITASVIDYFYNKLAHSVVKC